MKDLLARNTLWTLSAAVLLLGAQTARGEFGYGSSGGSSGGYESPKNSLTGTSGGYDSYSPQGGSYDSGASSHGGYGGSSGGYGGSSGGYGGSSGGYGGSSGGYGGSSGGYGGHHEEEHHQAHPYEFGYSVKDPHYGTDFGQEESSDGHNVKGSYRVALPDGRIQVVTYHADWKTGFHADVKYEGTAHYPEPVKHQSSGGYHYPSQDLGSSSYTGGSDHGSSYSAGYHR